MTPEERYEEVGHEEALAEFDRTAFTIEVHENGGDYLIIQKSPGKQQILATCPYPTYAEHVAEALRQKGSFNA